MSLTVVVVATKAMVGDDPKWVFLPLCRNTPDSELSVIHSYTLSLTKFSILFLSISV